MTQRIKAHFFSFFFFVAIQLRSEAKMSNLIFCLRDKIEKSGQNFKETPMYFSRMEHFMIKLIFSSSLFFLFFRYSVSF